MKRPTIILIILIILLSTCTPAPAPTPTPTATTTPKSHPTFTLRPTYTISPTPIPYDFTMIGLPVDIKVIKEFKKNFGCPTDYGDFTHDGNDIIIFKDSTTEILAVDDGKVVISNFVNASVGYEVYILLGYNKDNEPYHAVYVHLTDAIDLGKSVKKGGIIGYIEAPQDHLHFEIRIGEKPRLEFPGDGAPGDEIDVTTILAQYIPDELIGYDDRYEDECN